MQKNTKFLSKIFYHLFRFYMDTGDFFGSLFVYQHNPPKVGKFIKNIPYGNTDSKQRLDIVIPEGEGPFPIVIYIHGGGWLGGDKYHYTRIAKRFAHAGNLVFNVNYRLVPDFRFPAQLQDTADAIRWAYENAEKYGGDAGNIFLAGDSAGAHLASWYAAALNKPELLKGAEITDVIPREKIRGLLLFFGVYDMENACHLKFPGLKSSIGGFIGIDRPDYKDIVDLASPIRHLDSSYPPVFLSCGEVDDLYPQSVDLDKALESHQIPHKSLLLSRKEYPLAKHAFLYWYFFKCSKVVMKSAFEFIKENTEGD